MKIGTGKRSSGVRSVADQSLVELLAELERLDAKATPGPWCAYSYEGERPPGTHRYSLCREHEGPGGDDERHACVATVLAKSEDEAGITAHLLATLRNALPTILRTLPEALGESSEGPSVEERLREAEELLSRALSAIERNDDWSVGPVLAGEIEDWKRRYDERTKP